ncbi:MAG: uroporphyrinogen-III synthase [Salinivirgaceae bacterium]|nr:uroporphyrinogen-III synthase [Salinivirgaceae bacterium]
MKIRKILVSQPEPATEKSPYFDLAEKHNLKIDFRSFIQIEPVEAKVFRKERINILDFSAVIFTSRTAVDHFFRICEEMRISVPDSMKYFCVSEATAFYLQKYIVYRKRKIFFGKSRFDDLIEVMEKHKGEKFLLPLSDMHKPDIPKKLEKLKVEFQVAILYRTVASDLSDLLSVDYDILVFFSPSGIKSLFENFPEFIQNNTKIAAFGPTTAKAVKDAKLRLDIQAPLPEAPSMTMALDQYIKLSNKSCKK